MPSKTCNYCHEQIDFVQLDSGKWIPVDPGNHSRHRCKLEQHCADCRQAFEGAPWMTQCPACFKASRPNTRGFPRPRDQDSRRGKPAEKVARPREELKPAQDGFFDDIPF